MTPSNVSMPTDTSVRVERRFDTPVNLVWRAYTEPELFMRWCLGPPGWSMPTCEMDVRVEGHYRWRWRNDDDGKEFGFYGAFRDVIPERRLVYTQIYDAGDMDESMGEQPSVVTNMFQESSGVTMVTTIIDFASKEDRDAALETGMTDGMEMSFQKLDGVLAS